MLSYITNNPKPFITAFIILISLYFLYRFLKSRTTFYHSKQYWEARYEWFPQKMEWYTNFAQIDTDFSVSEIILSNFQEAKSKSFILEMGCGNSNLSIDMYKAGFKHIVAIDFSSVVIKEMIKNLSEKMKVKFEVCDFNLMDQYFEKGLFDVVIEKAGLDSIATKKSGDVPELLYKVYKNIYYVLSKGGIMLSMSNQNADFWKKAVFNRLEREKMFKLVECKKTTFVNAKNPIRMNLYFYYLKKTEQENN